MTFLVLFLLLIGLGLIDAGIKHQPIKTYIQSWIGKSNG